MSDEVLDEIVGSARGTTSVDLLDVLYRHIGDTFKEYESGEMSADRALALAGAMRFAHVLLDKAGARELKSYREHLERTYDNAIEDGKRRVRESRIKQRKVKSNATRHSVGTTNC